MHVLQLLERRGEVTGQRYSEIVGLAKKRLSIFRFLDRVFSVSQKLDFLEIEYRKALHLVDHG
jgi:hypothetical protein